MTDACTHFFRGTVAPGGACNDAVECASTTEPVVCLRAGSLNDDQPGVCRVMRRASAGEPCIVTTNERSYGASYGTIAAEADARVWPTVIRDAACTARFPEDVAGGRRRRRACDGLQCAPRALLRRRRLPAHQRAGDPCMSSSDASATASFARTAMRAGDGQDHRLCEETSTRCHVLICGAYSGLALSSCGPAYRTATWTTTRSIEASCYLNRGLL